MASHLQQACRHLSPSVQLRLRHEDEWQIEIEQQLLGSCTSPQQQLTLRILLSGFAAPLPLLL
jgi:hypothetical protein